MNKGIDHIGITSGHFEETARLYQEGLGFRIVHTWGRGKRVYMMETGDGTFVELFEGDPAPEDAGKKGADSVNSEKPETEDEIHPNGRWMHLALRTDNIQESYQRAIRAGFREKLPPDLCGYPGGDSGAGVYVFCLYPRI